MKWQPINETNRGLLRDESHLQGHAEQIFLPETKEDALDALHGAAGHPLTVQGGRTGLAGGCVPDGGWVLNLSRLDGHAAPELQPDGSATLWVEAGTALETVQKLAQAAGFFFPPNPTEDRASLGGLFSTNASGPNSLYYGPVSRWVTALDWVTPAGEERRDYERTCIDGLAGAEGSRGTILALQLRLLPQPKERWGILFFFRTRQDLTKFAETLRPWQPEEQVILTTAEYLDALPLLRANADSPLLAGLPPLPEQARTALYLELESPGEAQSAQALLALLDRFEPYGEDSWAENSPAAVRRLQGLRHAIPALLGEQREICNPATGVRWELDYAAPAEKTAWYLEKIEQITEKFQIPAVVYGHYLQNCLRVALLPRTAGEREKCDACLLALAQPVAEEGGCLAAEYGVGRLKKDLIRKVQNCRKEERTP